MGGGPRTETKSQSTSVNRPLQEAQPLVNRFINTLGNQFGASGGNDVIAGSSGSNTLMGSAGHDVLAGYGKRMPPGTSMAGGPDFDIGLTGAESGALDAMAANAAKGNPYAPQVGLLAKDLFAGGTDRTGMVADNLAAYRTALQPYTSMSTDPTTDSVFAGMLGDMSSKIMDSIKSGYAGAGYSPTSVGSFAGDASEGISRGIAPTLLQAKENLEARKRAAIDAVYGAGNTSAGLLNGMDQTMLGNRQAGVGVAGAALGAEDYPYAKALEIEAQRRGIPLKNAAQLASLIVPMAQLGSTTNQNSTSETQTHVSPLQTALGAGMAGVGLLSGTGAFGPAGWLLSGGGAGGGILNGMFGGARVPGAPLNLASFATPPATSLRGIY